MRPFRPIAVTAALLLAAGGLAGRAPAGAATAGVPVQPFLAHAPAMAGASTPVTVLVHGRDIAAARDAVRSSGLTLVTTFDRIGVAVARGTATQVQAAGRAPGVTGPYTSSRDKGTGLVDVVAAATALPTG